MRQTNYSGVRDILRPGHVIAFGGKGLVSEVIKRATDCNASHVGVVIYSLMIGSLPPVVSMIESTSVGTGFSGVDIVRLSIAVDKYDGEVWVVPLKRKVRKQLDPIEFTAWLIDQKGKGYDTPQAIMSAIDFVPDSEEDFSLLYCSELIVGSYKKGEMFDSELVASAMKKAELEQYPNASEQTPADVLRFPIYDEPIQIKGRSLELFR